MSFVVSVRNVAQTGPESVQGKKKKTNGGPHWMNDGHPIFPVPRALPCFEGRRREERAGEIRSAQRRLLSASDLMTGNDGLNEGRGDE
uniref:Uncharacterized protein n=1 Tax=Pristionchus pacificus TaxID=54126 RepID=A0A2A6B4N0_PRIPA|eukprot:PDM60845.1 hypothetical protein PRIPAC_54651 [Pristionchus pacificus]